MKNLNGKIVTVAHLIGIWGAGITPAAIRWHQINFEIFVPVKNSRFLMHHYVQVKDQTGL